jgi:phosphatidylglycerophosphate synthase
MISYKLGHFLDGPLAPFAKRIAIHPNILTIGGFVISAIAAVVIPLSPRVGGVLILLGGICDMFDGVLARVNGRCTRFGAFLDSLFDRYSDAFIFLSIAWYLAGKGDHTGAFLSIGTMVGALMVSYARARAESLGINSQVGLMERSERILLLILGLLTGWLVPVLWILFVLTHFTVVQRSYPVWRDRKESRKTR